MQAFWLVGSSSKAAATSTIALVMVDVVKIYNDTTMRPQGPDTGHLCNVTPRPGCSTPQPLEWLSMMHVRTLGPNVLNFEATKVLTLKQYRGFPIVRNY